MGAGTTIALIKALAPKMDPAVIEQAVSDWLDDHPEATTTVQDGSITEVKLNAELDKKIKSFESTDADAVSLFGQGTIQNVQIPGNNTRQKIIQMDLVANVVYCMNLKIKSAVSKTVYIGMYQSDGTIIGYSSNITAGNTYIFKIISPSTDCPGAYFGVSCADDFEIEYANLFSAERLMNQIGKLLIGDDISILSNTSTSGKQLNANGEPTDTSDATYYVTNDIEIKEGHWYMVTASAGYSAAYYAILDADHNVMLTERAPSGSGTTCVNRMIFTPKNSKYIRIAYITSLSGGHVALCNTVKPKRSSSPDWWNKFLCISYSNIGIAHTNTLETYVSAGHFGFNVCKGDVRPTSDGKLIMCHDPGFTFDENGRITNYDSSNKTLIHDMTYDQCMEKEYASQATATENNHYQKVADIDGFLQVCKQYGMIAFVTVRDEYIDTVCDEVVAALKRNNMLHRTIINSYTPEALSYIRMLCDDLPLSFVQSDDYSLGTARVNAVAGYGKAAITLVSTAANMRTYIAGLSSAIVLANSKGVGIMYAQPQTYEDVLWLINRGIMGAQIGKPCIPYQFKQVRFKISIASGTASLSEWFDMTTMEAEVSQSENVISVSEFKDAGSEHDFSDLIMEYWMNRFPYRITAISENGNTVTAAWQNNALKLTVNDISVNDTIDVIIEV